MTGSSSSDTAPMRELIRRALSRPEAARIELDRADGEESLLGYIRLVWPVLHPKRPLIEGWPLQALCEHLEAVHRREIQHLIINIPPGFSKSLTTGVFFPTWLWGPQNRPDTQFIGASYGQDLAIDRNLKARRIIQSDRYRELWGHRFKLTSDQNAKVLYENDHTGFMLATSVGGVGTGKRSDIFVIDDPHKVAEAESEAKRLEAVRWLSETVATRTSSGDTAFILIMQRLAEGDCSGHILKSELGWDHLCLPMRWEPDHPHPSRTSIHFVDPRTEPGELLWPALFPAERVDRDEALMSSEGGDFAVAGQHQQRPIPRGGGMCQRDKAQYLDAAPEGGQRCRGWDLASTERKAAAYTVGTKLCLAGDGRLIVEDVRRAQVGPDGVRTMLLAAANHDGHGVLQSIPQDPGQAGKSQSLDLARHLHGHRVRFSPETGDKAVRFEGFAAQWNAGNVWLVRAPWNDAYVAEVTAFAPGNRSLRSDQVDATSRAYGQLLRRRRQVLGGAPRGGAQSG